MSVREGRVRRLERALGHSLPWHLPMSEWTDEQLAAALGRDLASLTDADLAAMCRQRVQSILAAGDVPATIRADLEAEAAGDDDAVEDECRALWKRHEAEGPWLGFLEEIGALNARQAARLARQHRITAWLAKEVRG